MAHRDNVVLDVDERPAPWQWFGLSLQHMFSMFGSTVLVPILVGLNPGIALFSSGVGTLMYLLITKHKIPAYMGSSFCPVFYPRFLFPFFFVSSSVSRVSLPTLFP